MPEPSFLLGVHEFGENVRFVKSHEHPQKTVAETHICSSCRLLQKMIDTYTPHSTSIQHVSFSLLRLACLCPTSLDSSTLSTLTPLQTHENRFRTLYIYRINTDHHHTGSLFLWFHGCRRSSTVLLFRFQLLPANHIPHLFTKVQTRQLTTAQTPQLHTESLFPWQLGSSLSNLTVVPVSPA